MSHQKLSLMSAILININIMFGTGIFINTLSLATMAGFLGFLSYIIVLIFIIPLIFSVAALLRRHPSGGFYTYGSQDINPFAGFIAAWAYYTGKLGSVALLVHVFTTLLQNVVPALQSINTILIDCIIITLFTLLNTFNMKTSKSIMYTFFVFKITPILFAILSCLYLYNFWSIPTDTFIWSGIPASLPLVVYAFTGFEAACSLSSSIENSEKNGPRSIFISFGAVAVITIIYQFLFFLTAGKTLMTQTTIEGIFPALLNLLTNDPIAAQHITSLLYIAIATASLGGAYGILFSNHWNLYALAEHDHVFFKNIFTRLNKHRIPTFCVLLQGIICILYMLLTRGTITALQQISVLGLSIAFTICVLSLLNAYRKGIDIKLNPWVARCALGSCGIFITMIIRNFLKAGLAPLAVFATMFLLGCIMFIYKKYRPSEFSAS